MIYYFIIFYSNPSDHSSMEAKRSLMATQVEELSRRY